MKPKYPIPRPTERAALRRVGSPAALPVDVLFDRLLTARATGDREGVCLIGHRIVRGSPEGEPQ